MDGKTQDVRDAVRVAGLALAGFKPLWDNLNRYSHLSVSQMDLVAEKDFAALVTDSFNGTLARELLEVTDKVFDIAYAIVWRRFPEVIALVQHYGFIDEWKESLPNTIGVVSDSQISV